jgi:hypothetical protein
MDAPLQLYHSLTQICNWRCPYCEFPTLISPSHADLEYLKFILPMIKEVTDDYEIEHCVEGGELGIAPREILDIFFNSELAKTYHVSTNGKFLDKNLHKDYCNKIHSILYHVLPELRGGNFDFPVYDDYGIMIYYTIVVTKENIELIDSFFDYHSDKLFVPHVLQPRRRDIDLMNIDYYRKIYDIVKDKENIVPGFIKRYKYIVENFEKDYFMGARNKICCNDYTKMMIDYTTKTLIRCCISTETDRVNLNKVSLIMALKNDDLVFPSWDDTCDGCIANFVFRDIYYSDIITGRKNFIDSIRKMTY